MPKPLGTYALIDSTTLTTNTASVTFSSIPATFTDLVLVVFVGVNTSDDNVYLRFNGDTGSNYSRTELWGDGSSAGSARQSNMTTIIVDQRGFPTANVDNSSVQIFHIMDYSNTTTNKTVLGRANNARSGSGLAAGVGLWRDTSAINSVQVLLSGSLTFRPNSTFKLYGITAGNA